MIKIIALPNALSPESSSSLSSSRCWWGRWESFTPGLGLRRLHHSLHTTPPKTAPWQFDGDDFYFDVDNHDNYDNYCDICNNNSTTDNPWPKIAPRADSNDIDLKMMRFRIIDYFFNSDSSKDDDDYEAVVAKEKMVMTNVITKTLEHCPRQLRCWLDRPTMVWCPIRWS